MAETYTCRTEKPAYSQSIQIQLNGYLDMTHHKQNARQARRARKSILVCYNLHLSFPILETADLIHQFTT